MMKENNSENVYIFLVLSSLLIQVESTPSGDYLRAVVSELQDKSTHLLVEHRKLTDYDTPSPVYTHPSYIESPQYEYQVQDQENSPYGHRDHVSEPAEPEIIVNNDPHSAPELSLTKDELNALYKSAVKDGSYMDLDHLGYPNLHAAVHHVDNHHHDPDSPGYYYYYYPVQTFLNEKKTKEVHHDIEMPTHVLTKHEHIHEHKVHLDNSLLSDNKPKGVEPLFMAISGFIGMALMFVATVLFVPKFGKLKSRGMNLVKQASASGQNDLVSLTAVVVSAIQGDDCRERIACELGRAVRFFRMEDQPMRFLIHILPLQYAKQLKMVRQASMNKKRQCRKIQCITKKKKITQKIKLVDK